MRTPASPSYLNSETIYDLTALMEEKYASYGKEVKVLDRSAWSVPDMLTFDDHQVEAVQVNKFITQKFSELICSRLA